MKLLFLTLCLLCFFSCQNPPAETTETPIEKPEISDDLLVRLSAEMTSNPQTEAEKERNEILNYAIENNLNIRETQSGLFYLITEKGEGEQLNWGDKIKADYTGTFLDGQVFDSTKNKDEPLEFYIGNMIDGWNEGLQLLRPGAAATFLVPSRLGYGEKGIEVKKGQYLVPPGAVLRFDLKVVEKLSE